MRVVVTGASGQLGAYVVAELVARGGDVVAWSWAATGVRSGVRLDPVDLSQRDAVFAALDSADPDAIIHLAAITSVAHCYDDPRSAALINVSGTEAIAAWCEAGGRHLLYASTDLVFAGDSAPYHEDDAPVPTTRYGLTKLRGEAAVLPLGTGLVARLSLLFGRSRCGRPSFYEIALADFAAGRPRAFFEDEYRTPLDYATAARALVRLSAQRGAGIIHVAGLERVSRYELMRRLAIAEGIDALLVQPNKSSDVPGPERRPSDVSLDTTKLVSWLPDLERTSLEAAIRGGAR